MNATESTLKSAKPRLHRIQTVSRLVRMIMLGFFIFTIGYFVLHLMAMASPRAWLEASAPERWEGLGHMASMLAMETLVCVWYWQLARLFRLYERGLIFANETIRCIKTLGLLCIINWGMAVAGHCLAYIGPTPISSAGATIRFVPSSFSMGFFSFSINYVNFGMLLAGIIIVIIAWIMDEGRKIQEEQELTV